MTKASLPSFLTVKRVSETEYVINKSRFIGRCFPVESEEEATMKIAEIRKQHWDATHNCFAYRVGKTGSVARFSDDGEPSSTAGKPIMDVLCAKDITNVLCVVTRYFGGILLGAGGLVRAYSRSAADAVDAAGIMKKTYAVCVDVRVDYQNYSSVEAYVRSKGKIADSNFCEHVEIKAFIPEKDIEVFEKEITELTNGRITLQKTDTADFIDLGL
ncbi:MAG: YigZ family protein [Clostridia bacterium]|nr:YigZ family protein [Clostridia bacterium]